MNESTNRLVIALLALFTAIVHLVILNVRDFSQVFVVGSLNQMFALNGLGYLGLLSGLWLRIPAGQQRFLHYAFMAFTAITIVAWYVVNQGEIVLGLGVITKIVEILIIAALWMNLKYQKS